MGKGRWDKPSHPNDQAQVFPDSAASGPGLTASLLPLPDPVTSGNRGVPSCTPSVQNKSGGCSQFGILQLSSLLFIFQVS